MSNVIHAIENMLIILKPTRATKKTKVFTGRGSAREEATVAAESSGVKTPFGGKLNGCEFGRGRKEVVGEEGGK